MSMVDDRLIPIPFLIVLVESLYSDITKHSQKLVI